MIGPRVIMYVREGRQRFCSAGLFSYHFVNQELKYGRGPAAQRHNGRL